ncbi:MAG: hypothetical protein AAF497_29820 [Planctomycetota bacterium]
MMWKLWNRLFGFHYASIRFGDYDFTCRVRIAASGAWLVWPLPDTMFELHNDGSATSSRWCRRRYTPLTFTTAQPTADVVKLEVVK